MQVTRLKAVRLQVAKLEAMRLQAAGLEAMEWQMVGLKAAGLAVLVCFLLLPAFSWAEVERDIRGNATVDYWSRYGAFRFTIQQIRYNRNENIPVTVQVTNRGYRPIRIYPSAIAGRTFRFLLLDREGREIEPHTLPKTSAREKSDVAVVNLQGEEIKEIILAAGESFEKRLYLHDYYDLEPGREYRLSLYFYPDQRFNYFVRSTNTEKIYIEKAVAVGPPAALPSIGKAVPTAEEIVYLFLSAEVQQKWENYFKYLNLRKYIAAYNNFSVQYREADEQQKEFVLQKFADYLRKNPGDRLRRFRILGSTVEREPIKRELMQREAVLREAVPGKSVPGEAVKGDSIKRDLARDVARRERAFVRALGLREQGGYRARYRYTYTLERKKEQGNWKIVYVNAQLQ